MLVVSEREEGVLAIGPLNTRSRLEPVARCEPSSLADDIATAPSGPVLRCVQLLVIRPRFT